MSRGEVLVTVIGLLGTFLLPWPGGREPPLAAAQPRTWQGTEREIVTTASPRQQSAQCRERSEAPTFGRS